MRDSLERSIKHSLFDKHLSLLFYSIFFLLNIFQASLTELFDDEAYYWVCSRFPDWGYFDHPPMIAMLIKLGSALFSSELGVRFFPVLLSTISIYVLEKITDPADKKLFYAIILNILILHLGGILAVPDIPLFFFTVLFFWAYKKFCQENSVLITVFLSAIIALLVYSKYHGMLIILFTLISNIKLLRSRSTYIVMILSSLLLLPHIIWLWENEYPTIQYQLFERVSPPFHFSFITDFILGQLLIAGPLVGWLIIWAAIKSKTDTALSKAMFFSLVGFYMVFFISSFFTRSEMNWTIPILSSLVCLSYNKLQTDRSRSKWIYAALPFSLSIVLFMRFFMATDLFPLNFIPKDEYHQNKKWANEIRSHARDLPVVFVNSYQRASKYWFYSGDTSFSLNTFHYRRNGYNFWPLEKRIQHKKIMLVGSQDADFMDSSLATSKLNHSFIMIDSFFSNSQWNIMASSIKVEKGILRSRLSFMHTSRLKHMYPFPLGRIYLMIYPPDGSMPLLAKTDLVNDMVKPDVQVELKLPVLKEQTYTIRWGISNSYAEPTINSRAYKMVIRNSTQ